MYTVLTFLLPQDGTSIGMQCLFDEVHPFPQLHGVVLPHTNLRKCDFCYQKVFDTV
jgi:hypothetical protein